MPTPDNKEKRKSSLVNTTNLNNQDLCVIAKNYNECISWFKEYLNLLHTDDTDDTDDTDFIELLKKHLFETFQPFGDIYERLNIQLGMRYNPGSYKAEFKYPLYNRNIQSYILKYIKSINTENVDDITISHNILLNDKLRELYNEYHNITYNPYKDKTYEKFRDFSVEVLGEDTDFDYQEGGTKKYKSKTRKTRKIRIKRKKSKKGAK
jgi:hypothetical protein